MTVLEMSLGGGVMIAVILALRRALACRVPRWTFLLLWGAVLCRLLVPFSLPSQFSVYTGAAWLAEAVRPVEEIPAPAPVPVPVPAPDLPVIVWDDSPGTFREDSWTPPAAPVPSEPEREPLSPVTAAYLTGAALCGLFFGAAYLWSLRRFWDAVPAESDFIRRWREEHPTLFPVQIKVSGAVDAPLAYGLLRPVVLLPEHTDWSGEDQLTCILTHEYVHIRRGDLLWKLLLTAAVCVHWCNPLVWAMYFQANRDLELACDERVVRILGLENRKDYAYSLLNAAESRSFPLCTTYATKNHMEERIRAVMKMKKRSFAAVLAALLLVTGVTAVFATSKATEPEDISGFPPAVMTNQGGSTSAPAEKNELPGGNTAVPGEAGFLWPLPQEYQEVSNPFSERVNPITGEIKKHEGIDISAPKGTPVCAAKSGVVARSEKDTTYGNLVELSHSDGTATLYAHLSERTVEVGQTVKQGETIGAVGATGKATGPVLHFGIFMDGSPVDPAEQFKPAGVPADALQEPDATEPDAAPTEIASKPGKSSKYPVNSKGHTYGVWTEADGYEDVPDLIYVRWNSVTEGYLNRNEVYPYSWPVGPNSTQEELNRYLDWYHDLTKYDNPKTVYVPYHGASFYLYDQEENGVIGSCAGFEAYSRPDGHKLSDEALMELVNQGNPIKWSLFLGTAPIENIPDASSQPFRELPKTEEEWALLEKWTENGDWRRNSKGQTYGPHGLGYYVGYFPDLICCTASNGQEGYELLKDFYNSGYPGDIRRPEDALDYMDWIKTQPYEILLPVYDLECTHVIGYTAIQNTSSEEYVWPEEEIEYRLNMLENKFREWGLSEEEITQQLEEYKQSQGWD